MYGNTSSKKQKKAQKQTNLERKVIQKHLEIARKLLPNESRRNRVRIAANITRLKQQLNEINNKILPPTPEAAQSTIRREECLSREYWRVVFPSGRGSQLIATLKRILNWDHPPSKEEEETPLTNEVQKEAAKYFAHIGKAAPAKATTLKTHTKIKPLLRKKQVHVRTSDECGKILRYLKFLKYVRTSLRVKHQGRTAYPMNSTNHMLYF